MFTFIPPLPFLPFKNQPIKIRLNFCPEIIFDTIFEFIKVENLTGVFRKGGLLSASIKGPPAFI